MISFLPRKSFFQVSIDRGCDSGKFGRTVSWWLADKVANGTNLDRQEEIVIIHNINLNRFTRRSPKYSVPSLTPSYSLHQNKSHSGLIFFSSYQS